MSIGASAMQPSANRIIAVTIGLISTWGLAIGFIYPAVTINLENRGISPTVIGWMAAMTGLGIVANALVLPRLFHHFGRWRVVAASMAVMIVTIAGFALTETLWVWFVLRFMLGFSNNIIFVACETWINEALDEARRGRMIAIYTSVLSLTFACGPLLVPILGTSGFQAYGTVALIILLLGLPLWLLRHQTDLVEEPTSTIGLYRRVIFLVPLPMVAVVAFSMFDGATLALWVVFGQLRGLTETAAAFSLTILIIGNAGLQLPIGWLADRMSRRLLMGILTICVLAGCLALPVVDLTHWSGMVFLLFWGACAFGVYTIALVLIGQLLKGRDLIAANAAFGVIWGLFAMIGSATAGLAIDNWGAIGMPIILAVAYLPLLMASVLSGPTRPPSS